MVDSEIAKLYENLSLADEDGAVLEMAKEVKTDGIGDIDKCLVGKVLTGKKIETGFGIEIHDIPILCMNRRTAKWLAEQLGEVVEIPSKSRECWGKFMRVKVRLDISKPLKRWLRLKLGKSKEVTLVGLKYERLHDFCFVCGRIGHGIKECTDEEARKVALEGMGSSSDRSRSLDVSRKDEGDGSVSVKPGSRSLSVDSANPTASKPPLKEKIQETLIPVASGGLSKIDEMVVDGLDVGPAGDNKEKAQHRSAPKITS
ncbi:hypothetical protein EZV62_011267 [Acer yangbiense]|uniref:CCHC-type domain-containing protein n=1 Tax=Acer yangbiense TaxID=1000413 RepID=A0A5C7I410_9ROSI|nr:hypothetical protein EZV62_011267 [Acer yangbiense]